DEDADGLADCDDPDCAAEPQCQLPANDECAGATAAVEGVNAFDLTNGTASADAVDTTGCDGGYSGINEDVWFTWTAPGDGAVDVSTCIGGAASTLDTDMILYDGGCGALNTIGCSGDACDGFGSAISGTVVTAGETYLIRMSQWNGGTGSGEFELTYTAAGSPEDCSTPGDEDADGLADCDDPDCAAEPQCQLPANDECAGATATGEAAGIAVDTSTATIDATPSSCGLAAADVWLAYTASCTGTATIETTSGPGGDTILEVLDACGGAVLACDDDGGAGFLSLINLPVTSGTTYFVRASGWNGGAGSITMDISCAAAGTPEDCATPGDEDADGLADCADPDCAAEPQCQPPANDECAGATAAIEGGNAYDLANATTSADAIDGTPCDGGFTAPNEDVWFSFTPATDGIMDLTTCGGSVGGVATDDSDLVLYEGSCGTLTQIGCNGDACGGGGGWGSAITGTIVTAGSTYYFRLSSWNGGNTGQGTLDVTLTPLAAEDCLTPGDEDGDGLADCDDPDCVASPNCIEAGNCGDNIDNDGDGNTDCADADCAADLACLGCPTSLTQNLDTTTVDDNMIACANQTTNEIAASSYARSWDTSVYDCPDGIRVTAVDVGIGFLSNPDGLGLTLSIDVYVDGNGGEPDSGMTLLSTEDFTATDADANSIMTVTLTTPAPLYSGQTLVVAARAGDMQGTGNVFRFGRNTAGATHATYLDAPACALPWGPLSDIGFGDHDIILELTTDDLGSGVAGDECTSAINVTDGANAFDSTGMTNSADPAPAGCTNSFGANSPDIWFTYTATSAGEVTADTCDVASFDTDLSVYSGDCGNLTLISCDGDDANGDAGCQSFASRVNAGVVAAGDTLYFRVGGWGAAGTDFGPGTLNITNVPPLPIINEIRIDNGGSDTDEYTELAGLPQDMTGLFYIVIGDGSDTGNGSGVIERVIDLAGETMNPSGYWTAGNSPGTLGATMDVVLPTNAFENGDTVTHMLVTDFTGSTGDDLDTDDDGTLDVEPWSSVADSITLHDDDDDTPDYSTNVIDLTGTEGHIERCPDFSGPWVLSNFDTTAGSDTPGATNNCLAPPENDECDGAIVASTGINDLYNVNATDSADAWDPACADSTGGAMASDVWYSWTAPADGAMSVSTCDTSGFDTDLGIYSGDCGTLTQIACSGDAGDGSGNGGACQSWYSAVSGVLVTAGETYMIRIGGWDATSQGSGTFTLGFGPANDEPCDAIVVTDGTTIADNTFANDSTVEADPTQCDGTYLSVVGADLWYEYTATCDGQVSIDTCDVNGFDTDLVVYQGDCSALTIAEQITCNGDGSILTGCQGFFSEVTFPAVSGDTYLIRVGGWNGAQGVTELHISCEPDAEAPTASFNVAGSLPISLNFQNVTLSDSSDDGGDATATIEIDWGDGNTETAAVGSSTIHLYAIDLASGVIGFEATPSVTITNIIDSDTATGDTIRVVGLGDANNDLASDAADMVYLLTWMYLGGPAMDCYQAGDLNGDETADLGDAVYGLYYLFVAGSDLPVIPANPLCDL
ncbi:MAG: hypothetical protein AAEJ04_06585, partial [Planctomycetota bacterium]